MNLEIENLVKDNQRIHETIIRQLIKDGWDAESAYDPDWGWMVLAGKHQGLFGYVLRRILPIATDPVRAEALQQRLKHHLIEVWRASIMWDKNRHRTSIKLSPFWYLGQNREDEARNSAKLASRK